MSTRGAACNGKPAGAFLSGQQPLYKAGTDGLVNTADDDDLGVAGMEESLSPGPDNILGNSDDVRTNAHRFHSRDPRSAKS